MNKEEKKIQHIQNPEKANSVKEEVTLSHINPHNFADYLERIGNIEGEVEKDKNEIKSISEKLDLHIATLNEKADVSHNLIIGVLIAFLLFCASLLYAHFEIIPKLENQINLQQEKIQNLEDDIKELKDIIIKIFY